MDLDTDGEVDADGETEKNSVADAEERERSIGSGSGAKITIEDGVLVKSKPIPATATGEDGRALLSGTPGTPTGAQSDAQKASQATLLQIQTIMALRAPIFDLPNSATIVDPASLSYLTASLSEPLSLATLFPDLPIYSDFQLATDFPSDKRIEESSAWAGRLSNVSKHFDTRPLLVSTVMPSRTRGREGGWDPMTKNWLDETKETVPEHHDQPVSRSSEFRFASYPRICDYCWTDLFSVAS